MDEGEGGGEGKGRKDIQVYTSYLLGYGSNLNHFHLGHRQRVHHLQKKSVHL